MSKSKTKHTNRNKHKNKTCKKKHHTTTKCSKHKKTKTHKRCGKRIYGGNKTPEQIMTDIKDEREKKTVDTTNPEDNIGSEVLNKSIDLVEGVALNSVDHVSDLLGVDLTNEKETQAKLDDLKDNLSNEETRTKILEVVGEASEVGAIALEAAKPFVDPLIDTIQEKSQEVLKDAGETAVKVMLNSAEAIPGVGIVVGTVRSLSTIGDSIVASTNAGAEVLTTASDSLNAATQNFNQIMNDKQHIVDRTNKSLSKFSEPLTHDKRLPLRGGTKKHSYQTYGRTKKKVHFLE
tara:strand:+ start:948 stop:1820 length:873 start_codon:yes stop_codon:yes gene_type:complete